MTEKENQTPATGSNEGALERALHNGDTTLERLAARILEDMSDTDSSKEGEPRYHQPVMVSEKYTGPFAHPDLLEKLNEVVDDGAERAFRLTEREQEHRHAMERAVLDASVKQHDRDASDRRLVIVLLFVFLALSLGGAIAAIMTGHSAGGGLVAGAAAIITAGGYLISRSRRNQD